MSEKRLEWADIAKGIGIILVVFAHTIVPALREKSSIAGFIWIFIYNFHMPLFFFISGWLFEKNIDRYTNKIKFIAGKARLLMLPYLVFSVFAYAVVLVSMRIPAFAGILAGGGYGSPTVKSMILGILCYCNHIDRHLWFVYSLFIVFAVNVTLTSALRSKPALLVLLVLYVSKAFVRYPAILDYTASDLLFFSLARAMYSDGRSATVSAPFKFAISAAVFVTANIIYSYFYVSGMPDGFLKAVLYITRAVCSAAGIVTVCTISEFIAGTRAKGFFSVLGMYSYDIYLIHAPFLVSGLMGILLSYSPLPPFICRAAVTAVGLAVPYTVSRLVIRKISILSLILLGQKKKTR